MNKLEAYHSSAEAVARFALEAITKLDPPNPFDGGAQLCDAMDIAQRALDNMEQLWKMYIVRHENDECTNEGEKEKNK